MSKAEGDSSSLPSFLETASRIVEGVTKATKQLQISFSDWPAFPEEDLGDKSPFVQVPRETWEFYRKVMAEDKVRGWYLLKAHEQWYSEQIEISDEEWRKWPAGHELRHRSYLANAVYFIRRHTLRRFVRRYMMTLTVPGELSQEEVNELSEGLPIPGYHAAEYAEKARDILKEHPSISSFSKLIPKMGTSGESKVDTIKEGIGYNDLPREEKTFGTFKKLLFKKVRLMEKGKIT